MSIEQILYLIAAIVLSETVLPYGQMVISYDTPESEEDLWVVDFMRAILRFDLLEVVAKIAAYALATKLFLEGEMGSAFVVMGVAGVNMFYLAPRKLDRFYQADSTPS